MLALLTFWILCGLISTYIATSRGSNGCLWFVLGVLLGPVALVLALFEGSQCPYCRSLIHAKAVVCPKCQRELNQVFAKDSSKTSSPVEIKERARLELVRKRVGVGLLIGFAVFILILAIIRFL